MEVNSTWLITAELANQRATKTLLTCVVYTCNVGIVNATKQKRKRKAWLNCFENNFGCMYEHFPDVPVVRNPDCDKGYSVISLWMLILTLICCQRTSLEQRWIALVLMVTLTTSSKWWRLLTKTCALTAANATWRAMTVVTRPSRLTPKLICRTWRRIARDARFACQSAPWLVSVRRGLHGLVGCSSSGKFETHLTHFCYNP